MLICRVNYNGIFDTFCNGERQRHRNCQILPPIQITLAKFQLWAQIDWASDSNIENIFGGSVNMRDSGFLLINDANIGYRREQAVSEREYSVFGIFNLKITHFFPFTLTFTCITMYKV